MSRVKCLVIVIAVCLLVSAVPGLGVMDSGGVLVTKWTTGEETKSRVFTSPGTDTQNFAFELERDANITTASFTVEGMDDGSGNYPRNVTVNLDGTGDPEYRFRGEGYGDWGHQYMFNTTDEETTLRFQGANDKEEAYVLLPKGANVTSARLEVEGGTGSGMAMVAVEQDQAIAVGSGGADNVVSQLNDETYLDFDATQVDGSQIDSQQELDDYDVVVVGDTGSNNDDHSSFQTALKNWVYAGGGCVATGWIVYSTTASNDIDFCIPVNAGAAYSWNMATQIVITNSNHPVTTGVTSFTPSGHIEYSTGGADPGTTTLATCNSQAAVVVGTYGAGHIVYLGMLYMASDSYSTTGLRTGMADRLLEQAVSWAASGSMGPGPENATLDVGKHGGTPDWEHPNQLSSKELITGWESSLNTYLRTHEPDFTDGFGNEMCAVPLNFSSDTDSRLKLLNLSIEYDYKATVFKRPGPGNLTSEVIKILANSDPQKKNVTIAVHVSTDAPGKVQLSDLAIGYDDAPVFLPIGPWSVPEDTLEEHLFDIADYVLDDIDDPVNLTYKVISNTLPEHLLVYISDDHYLAADATVDRDWNSESGDGGIAEVRLRATDSGNHSIDSPVVFIEVTPVNDEPVTDAELKDLVLEEGEEDHAVLLSAAPYFFDVEYDMLHFDVVVDPLEVWEGEEDNLTAEIDPISRSLRVTAHGDFHTGDGPAVPLWVFADDDTQVNTIADGYLPSGKHNWTFQELNVTVININDGPLWEKPPNIELDEDAEALDEFNLRGYVSDVDNDVDDITFKLGGNTNKRIKVTIGEDGWVSVTPNGNVFGTTTVTAEADDGEDDSETTFKVTVNPIDDVPGLVVQTPVSGTTAVGNITIAGTAADIESDIVKVEYMVGEGGMWTPAAGTEVWDLILDTALHPNGPLSILLRSFDGELYSGNVTLNITIDNPVNLLPAVSITSPRDGAGVEAGVMTIQGTASDADGTVTKVKVRLGDTGEWTVARMDTQGWLTWSFELNNTGWAGGNLTICARALDGMSASPDASVTFSVAGVQEPSSGDETKTEAGSSGDDGSWLWLLLIIVMIVVLVLVLLIIVIRNRDRQKRLEEEEEEERRREEEETARAASLRVASAMGSAGAYAPSAPGLPAPMPYTATPAPPLPPPPAGVAGTLPPLPPPPMDVELLPPAPAAVVAAAVPAAPVAPPPPPPPPAGAPAPPPPPPPPPPTPAGMPAGGGPTSVACYVCGGSVPITSDVRPLRIQCPSCGAAGEI